MSNMEELINLTEELTDQELTDYIDWLRSHMKDRANRRNAKARATIKVGDRVVIAGKTKPQYLMGMTGEVTEKKQSRVTIKLDRGPTKKFRSGNVIISAGILEVIK